jgi:DNA polymerase-1
VNWNSPQQILKAFGLLGVKLPDTKKETLSALDHPLAAAILEYRKAKNRVDFCRQWLDRAHDGRVCASWRQVGAETGRMSCAEPNLQNLPKEDEMRRLVCTTEGWALVKADYSQMELRILAKLSGDPALLEAFEMGEDHHKATAAKMFGVPPEEVTKKQRSAAKAVGFGIIYGMEAPGLAARLGTDKATAARLIDQYFATYPKVQEYRKRTAEEALKIGLLRTPIGRLRRFEDASLMKPYERKAVKRAAMNFPIQGACADGQKLALALLYERRHECPGAVPVLAVHDEIVVECHWDQVAEVEAWLKKAMVDGMDEVLNASELDGPRVPVEVEVKTGRTWGE